MREKVEQIIFFVLAGTLDKFTYGAIVGTDILLLYKIGDIPIEADPSNNAVLTFSIGGYGRGMFISDLPFEIKVLA